MPKRILTEDEKANLVRERYDYEVNYSPGFIITVSVKDETDENGHPKYVITWMKESGFHPEKPVGT